MLGINVTYTMKPGMREEFLRRLEEGNFRQTVLAEAGCLGYDYYRGVEDENILLLVERWTERKAQEVHMTRPHMVPLKEIKERCVADSLVEKFDA